MSIHTMHLKMGGGHSLTLNQIAQAGGDNDDC